MGKKTSVTINANKRISRINPNIYGHFAEHLGTLVYDGIWVGPDSSIPNVNGIRKDVVEALRAIKPPVIRWPGGCFADDYHWRDGIGPRESRPRTINIHWNSIEPNQFGTHEFMEFCQMVGAKAYVCGNVGSGSVKEMRDWVEYMNYPGDSTLAQLRAKNGHPEPFNVEYFGIGNENWGCGGNMSPRYYAYQYKKYAGYIHAISNNKMYKIACGPNSFDFRWTRSFFKYLCENKLIGCPFRLPLINGFAMHYYCGTSGPSATQYNEDEWYDLLRKARRMQFYIKYHKKIMDYFAHKRVDLIVDEWGTWHKVEEGTDPKWLRQQNTIRDALVAAHTLDIFNNHCDLVAMSNIAQVINVLQSMILTEGKKMVLTPTYFVYQMYAAHQDGHAFNIKIDTNKTHKVPVISGSCSIIDNMLTLSLVNSHVRDANDIEVKAHGINEMELTLWKVLATEDIHDHNTFDEPKKVKIRQEKTTDGSLTLPAASVNLLQYKILKK